MEMVLIGKNAKNKKGSPPSPIQSWLNIDLNLLKGFNKSNMSAKWNPKIWKTLAEKKSPLIAKIENSI